MQQEEWKFELIRRAENILISQATGIPSDQLDTMRMHPEFTTAILPAIASIKESMKTGAQWIECQPKNLLEA